MYLGMDIGGSKMEIAALNIDSEVIIRERLPTPGDDYELFLNTIKQLVDIAISKVGEVKLLALSMCGLVNNRDRTVWSANLPYLNDKDLFKDLANLFSFPVYIENDCRCFAISEAIGGAADKFETVFGAILGTGVGGGFVIRKRLLSGKNGIVGEWGHSCIDSSMQQKYKLSLLECGCGKKGCIEQYISGRGISNLYRIFFKKTRNTEEIIFDMQQGCQDANYIFNVFIDILSNELSSLTNIIDPDAIVLGGGLSNITEIYPALRDKLEKKLLSKMLPPVILPPQYLDSSGVRGAVLFAIEKDNIF